MKITYFIAPDRGVYASRSWDPSECSAERSFWLSRSFHRGHHDWAIVAQITENGQLVNWRGMSDDTPAWAGGDAEAGALQACEPLMVGETFTMELSGPVPAEPAAEDEWRRLALQFDGHRMQALGHLKALLNDFDGHGAAASQFLAAPPLDGEAVLAERIKALAHSQGDGCQFCLGAKGGVPGNGNRLGGVLVCDYCHSLLMTIRDAGQAKPADHMPEPFTLQPTHNEDSYEGVIAILPGELLVTMGLTLVDSDSAYLTFDVGSLHESGDPVEYPISRAAADDILATCLEK